MPSKVEQTPVLPEKLLRGQDKWNLPPIERKQYAEFVRGAKSSLTLGQIINNAMEGNFSGGEFPEEDFNAVYEWWTRFEETKALMVRFATAVKSEYVPDREKRKAAQNFSPVRQSFEKLIGRLQQIAERSSISGGEAKVIAAEISEFEELQTSAEQIIALCEAIDQSRLTDPREIRQYIAQHSIEELSNAFLYENIYYAADVDESAVVADDLETERRELLAALLRGEWSKKKTDEMRELYERWRN